MWILWYALTGFLSGMISGMGIGGGAVMIPALGLLFGMAQQQAQGVNLIYFIPTAAIAVLTHRKKGNIEKKGLAKWIFFGLIGAASGALLAVWIKAELLRRIFGGFLLFMGIIEFFKKTDEKEKKSDSSNKEGAQT